MAYVDPNQITDGLQDVLLAATLNGKPLGLVERFTVETQEEEETDAIFVDEFLNPTRTLFEVHVIGTKMFNSSQGRFEVRRDHIPLVEGWKAFEFDAVNERHSEQAVIDAWDIFNTAHFALLQHSNIDAGTGARGIQVAEVNLAFDPRATHDRGGTPCWKAVYSFRFLNQPEETT